MSTSCRPDCSLETELTQQRCIPTARAIINILKSDLRGQEAREDRNSTLSNDIRACYNDGPAHYCGTLRPLTTQSVRHRAYWILAGTLRPWSKGSCSTNNFTLVNSEQTRDRVELYFRSQFVFQWRYVDPSVPLITMLLLRPCLQASRRTGFSLWLFGSMKPHI